MTTVEQRIVSLAAARGGVANIPPRVPRPPTEHARTPQEAKTGPIYSRLPMSWQRIKDRWQEPSRAASTAETRAACYWVARALGDDWRKEVTEYDRCDLVHTSGLRLRFGKDWNTIERYSISALDCVIERDAVNKITVHAGRTPAAIAADIERRLLPQALDGYQRRAQSAKNSRDGQTRSRLEMLAIARALGMRQLKEERNWSHQCYPETNTAQFDGFSVAAHESYSDRVHFSIECRDQATALRIAQTLQELNR